MSLYLFLLFIISQPCIIIRSLYHIYMYALDAFIQRDLQYSQVIQFLSVSSRFFGSELCIRAAEHQCFFKETENEKLFVDLKRFLKPLFLRVKGLESDEGSARHFYATGASYSPLGLSWLCIMTKQPGGTLTVIYTVLTITISGSPHRWDCLEAGDQSSFISTHLTINISE